MSDAPWTIHKLAGELFDLMPLVGHTVFQHTKVSDEEKTTLMQVRVLHHLIDHPQPTVSMLAKKRGVSLQAVSTLVQGLVERGWVTRVPDPQDRRQSLLEVTPEGRARAKVAKDQMVAHLVDSLDGLTPEEIDAARVFLPALRRILIEHIIADRIPDDPPDDLPDDWKQTRR